MRIAYLAPEIPALSATFVYNEMLAVEELGHEIIPFSVHKPQVIATDTRLEKMAQRVINLYSAAKPGVVLDHFKMLFTRPQSYLKALGYLFADIWQQGVFKRNCLGLVYRFFFAARLARQMLGAEVEHLHVHFAHVPTDIAMYAGAMSGIDFSVTAHANDIFERGWLLKAKVARSRFFATISEFNKRYLVAECQVDVSKLRIIRCGVDTRLFQQREVILTENSSFKLGLVGRLVEKKGIDCLLKAVGTLYKEDANAAPVLYIAGSGPLERDLKALAVQQGLGPERVHFVGALPHDQVATFVRSLDIFVLPCKPDSNGDMDGIPVVLMEAMMTGIPVISTQLSGIPELVINEQTGLTVLPDNVEQLVTAIKRLQSDSALREMLAKKACKKVETEFSLMGNAKRLLDYINAENQEA